MLTDSGKPIGRLPRRAAAHRIHRDAHSRHGRGTLEAKKWAHNLVLTRELVRAGERRGITLGAHHHDWWFDNHWLRWPAGLGDVAGA